METLLLLPSGQNAVDMKNLLLKKTKKKAKKKGVQCKKKARFDIFWLSTYLSTNSKNTRGKIDFACSDIFQQN